MIGPTHRPLPPAQRPTVYIHLQALDRLADGSIGNVILCGSVPESWDAQQPIAHCPECKRISIEREQLIPSVRPPRHWYEWPLSMVDAVWPPKTESR